MNSIFSRVGCAVALLAIFPAFAAPAAPPAPLDPSRIATHLEAELKAAHQAVEKHGARMEGLVGPSLRGDALATEARALQAELPDLIRDNPHLFEELLGTLRTLEQPSPGALPKQGPGLSKLLNEQLLQGIHRFGQRVGAPPALVVSGGVSLGSYQAGFLYYYTLFLHDRAGVLRAIPSENRDSLRSLGVELPDDPPGGFTIVTGASAGSVNALLSAYAGCRAPERIPSKSLFFQTWNTLALETLLQPGSVGTDHTFSSKPVMDAIERLKTLDPDGWRKCRFSLGATTTRLQGREIDLAQSGTIRSRSGEQLRLARFTEKFLLTAQGDAQRAPEFCPFPGCDAQAPYSTFYPRLAQPEGGPIPVDNVFNMVAASGAFPTAFEPRVIAHRYFDTRTGKWVEDNTARFADGGIYNNNPLDLALRMSQWETPALRGSHRILYFDPNAVDWKWAPEQTQPFEGPGLLATYEDLLAGFAGTAMSAQLMDTLETEPDIRERIDVPVRHAPLAGEYLLAMSAFLDEDFRTFDFHRGMVDAWHFVSKESDTRILFQELAHANPEAPPTTVGVDSPLFACFLAFEQSVADEPATLPACSQLQTEESQNVLSLMAVSRKMRKDPTLSLSNNFERFTEALATRGYVFRSGLLKGQTASALQGKFRQVFGDAVTELTHQQPRSQQLGFGMATKLALDSAIAYQPVPFYSLVGITSGGLELAVSPSLMHWKEKELRLRSGVRVSYGESVRFSGGVSPPDFDTAAYVSGAFGFGPPPIRFEAGLGLLTEASYIPDTSKWVAVRFALEGSVMVVAAEHLEISLRPRLYLDGGRASSPLYVPTTTSPDAPQKFEALGLLLGAGWRF
ncbi:MAG TPA: patatin-like phospholipase family protein [Archangium sp.]|uniref:patatin-like phospholipase family protein n=1 Tax=Archangium sp. TaxID=1872627 RepID=UPI002E2EDE34|nr:patatin-like phospholipase family protein [Archangium sp.]HEX5749682.1 patatin-like phospholipase family protein [Archangium sp.]